MAGLFSYMVYKIRMSGETIESTGSAKEEVLAAPQDCACAVAIVYDIGFLADYGRWSISLETRVGMNDQQSGFETIENATGMITAYVESKGFIDIEPLVIRSYPNYSYPQYGEPTMTGYTISREIIVRSDQVDNLTKMANDISSISGAGYTISTNSLEYTYSKLDEMPREDAIASETGRKIDVLKSASSGVVQVMSKGNLNISDYGYYDTQSKNKEIMVTVRAIFKLK